MAQARLAQFFQREPSGTPFAAAHPLLPSRCALHTLAMGGAASEPVKRAAVQGGLRRAGDNLNTLGYNVVHEKVFMKPAGKPIRQTICRCWLSLKFPLCDNTHQRLQKQGINCGPCMLEVKPGVVPVSAQGVASAEGIENLGARPIGFAYVFASGGVAAAALAGAAHVAGVGPFPL
mmetsp:Transcript_13335/g.35781  ORF Transcript_13335/g.35781 Transcript_13335/m.35781 type:complete len:176 (-) Transcript_13335:95-622(-)